MKTNCIIVAGGRGKRMGADTPKQFLPIAGHPLLMHTIENIISFDSTTNIIVVLPSDEIDTWKDLCISHDFHIKHQIVEGGSERFFSVKNALDICDNDGLIAVHDGVRPFVSKETWTRCMQCATENGTAIPCVAPTSSLRMRTEDSSTVSVDRTNYLEVQTPQMFRAEIIKQAYEQAYTPTFTDDASVSEKYGHKTFTTEGNIENIKITTVIDLKFAEILIHRTIN